MEMDPVSETLCTRDSGQRPLTSRYNESAIVAKFQKCTRKAKFSPCHEDAWGSEGIAPPF
jgi:hypothetical protein